MHNSLRALIIAVFFSALLSGSSAWAYWFGTIPSDNVSLKEAPNDGSSTVETLMQGARFTATDQPVDGYYRVRTKTNTGYIEASIIDSQNPKQNAAGSPAPTPTPTPEVAQRAQPTSTRRKKSRSSSTNKDANKWSVTLLVGDTLSNPSDVSSAIGSTSLSDPLGLGLELAYRVNNDWRLAFRTEYIAKGLSGTNSTNDHPYQIEMKGYTFTVGADYFLANQPKYDIFLGLRVGLGIANLSSEQTDLSSNNNTTFSGIAVAGNLALGADYKAWSWLWFGAEGGYQLFKTGDISPTYPSTGSSGTIWPSAIPLSFSGISLDLNLRILF
jgi:opacity protein-like surface antigen